MVKKVIKIPFVEEVTGKAGAMVRLVEQSTQSLDTTVQAAIDGLFVIGQAQLVKNNFLGLFKSMAEGVQRDGKPRKIADFIRLYPVFEGTIDLDKGFDPETNGVYLAAALLNEMKLDISKWTFEDVTKGRQAITIESVTGANENLVDASHDIAINGHGLSGEHRVELQLEGGELVKVAPAHVTGNITRIDVAKAALAAFDKPENYGKALTITVRGNFANASKTVKFVKSEVPPTPTLKVTSTQTGGENEVKLFTDDILIEGTEVENLTDAYLELYDTHGEFVARMQHMGESRVERIDGTHVKYYIRGNTSTAIDAQWEPGEGVVKLVIARRDAENLVVPIIAK